MIVPGAEVEALPLKVTVSVKVTDWPTVAGFGDEVSVLVVGCPLCPLPVRAVASLRSFVQAFLRKYLCSPGCAVRESEVRRPNLTALVAKYRHSYFLPVRPLCFETLPLLSEGETCPH